MDTHIIRRFVDILTAISSCPETAWLYLPHDGNWTLNTGAALLESVEVPPQMEDIPNAGVPEFAKQNGLVQCVPVGTLQDIVANAQMQKRKRPSKIYSKHSNIIITNMTPSLI